MIIRIIRIMNMIIITRERQQTRHGDDMRHDSGTRQHHKQDMAYITHTHIHSHTIIYDLIQNPALKIHFKHTCRGLSEKVGHEVHIRLIVKKFN